MTDLIGRAVTDLAGRQPARESVTGVAGRQSAGRRSAGRQSGERQSAERQSAERQSAGRQRGRDRTTADVFAGSGLLASHPAARHGARLRTRCGLDLPFSAERWHAPAAAEEVVVLSDVSGPVLDLACGPGRLVRHLVDRGIVAMGVDAAPDAVAAATARGAPAVLGDLWETLPMEGSWGTVLLFDGNIGIGSRPGALLARCGRLLAPGGAVMVEVGAPGTGQLTVEARIEWGGWHSAWFPWATVDAGSVRGMAGAAGFDVDWVRRQGHRWFARMVPASEPADAAA